MEDLDWDIEDFTTWVQSLPSDKIVGFFRSRDQCPLVLWRAFLGDEGHVTANFFWPLESEPDRYLLPLWARKFIILGDKKYYVHPFPSILLSILDLVKGELS